MSDLRSELRELRKKSPAHMSVSKMKMKDIAMEVGKLRAHLESSPSIAHDGSKSKKPMKSTVESVKEAKEAEFPVAPSGDMEAPKASKKKVVPLPEAPAKARAKKEMVVEAAPEHKSEKKGRPAKGSEEMKAKMQAIRMKKSAK